MTSSKGADLGGAQASAVSAGAEAEALFARGLALHRQGRLPDAQGLYRQVLAVAPRHLDALHHLGMAALQTGRASDATTLISAALAIDDRMPELHANLARGLAELGRFDQALASYDRAVAINPRFARAFVDRGNVLLSLQRPAEAAASFDRASRLDPHDANAPNGHGNALLDLERPVDAIEKFDQAIRLDAQFSAALFNRANALRVLGRIQEAISSYDRVLELRPEFTEALINRGMALQEIERYEESLLSLDRALKLAPGLAFVHYNRAVVLLDLQRPAEALASVDRALGLQPDASDALNCRGIALLQLNRGPQALETLDRALALRAEYPDALHNRGIALMKLRRFDEALASFEAALSLRPNHASTIADAGRALLAAGQFPQAGRYFAKLHDVAQDYEHALGNRFYADQHCADWSAYESHVQQIVAGIAAGRRVVTPFCLLSASDSAGAQHRCAEIACTGAYPASTPLWRGERYGHAKIRVAYLSSDLREHAISYLLAGVFEQHDRSRFDLTALSLRPAESSPMGLRVQQAFDRFIDVSRQSDAEVAALIRALEVDVLIDLNGYTQGMRTAILARRPAAVQVNYLGFPATMGAPFVDYLIADTFVIPTASQEHYSEKIAYLPQCFQANDDRRARSAPSPDRRTAGVPEHGLLLCSFNNTFKLNPRFFDIWMRALKTAPSSFLWLLGDHESVQARLCERAAASGVDPGRLLFAPRLPYAEHLARCACADLFLDSIPFNAGATASDALWAGVPILTCAGEAFAARMAGSLLRNLGLPELITYSAAEYELRLLELLGKPQELAGLRVRLGQQRERASVFDTRRFTRQLEAAFVRMHQRACAGQAPATFYVEGQRKPACMVCGSTLVSTDEVQLSPGVPGAAAARSSVSDE